MTTIAERLTEAMERYGIGVRELSRRTGINAGDISHYCNGQYTPRRERIHLLSQALNVSPAWLMGFDLPENEWVLDNEILDMWHQLTVNQQEEVYQHIKSLLVNRTEEV